MPEVTTPVDLGLSEFVSKLVEEVLDAVVASQISQDSHAAELLHEAGMSVESFAARNVTQDQVDAEVGACIAGAVDREGKQFVLSNDIRASLAKWGQPVPEQVPTDGYALLDDVMTARLWQAARLGLAADRQRVLAKLLHDGFPRVTVTDGEIRAKVSFKTVGPARTGVTSSLTADVTEGLSKKEAKGVAAASVARPAPNERDIVLAKDRLALSHRADALHNVRVTVSTPTVAESSAVEATATGEILLHFATKY